MAAGELLHSGEHYRWDGVCGVVSRKCRSLLGKFELLYDCWRGQRSAACVAEWSERLQWSVRLRIQQRFPKQRIQFFQLLGRCYLQHPMRLRVKSDALLMNRGSNASFRKPANTSVISKGWIRVLISKIAEGVA